MRVLLIGIVLLAGCGGAVSSLYDEQHVSEPCSVDGQCGGVSKCVLLPDAAFSICMLLRENGQHCPAGGNSIAYGYLHIRKDGSRTEEAYFGCFRECGDSGDCPGGDVCAEGQCHAPH